MAKELQKTLKLENEEYNINAVRSDTAETADKTQAALTLNGSFDTGVSTTAFNGNIAQTIEYMPPKDGKFTGPTYITSPTTEELTAESIINAGQINDKIAQLTGAPLYTVSIDSGYQLYSFAEPIENGTAFRRLNTVIGTSENFENLKKLIANGSTGLNYGWNGVTGNVPTQNTTSTVAGFKSVNPDPALIIPYTCTYESNGVKTPGIPVTGIKASAFENSTAITSVVIPDCIEIISNNAFKGCTNLKTVTILHGVKEIGEEAFSGCSNLESLILPSSIVKINKNAFSNCSKLKTIKYGGSSSEYSTLRTKNTVYTSQFGGGNAPIYAAGGDGYTLTYQDSGEAAMTGSFMVDSPFMYVCSDTDSTTSPASNKVFLKLPGEDFVEISKGAARLNSTTTNENTYYYTYDNLAEIIARINNRLAAIEGSKKLAIPDEVLKVPTTLVPEESIDVPTLDGLAEEIIDETTYDTDLSSGPVLRAVGGIAVGDSLVKEYEDDGVTPKTYYSVKEILDKMLYPYTKPAINSFTISPDAAVREKGTSITITSAGVSVTKKTNTIDSITLYRDNAIVNTSVSYYLADGKTATTEDAFKIAGGVVKLTCSDRIAGTADTYKYYVKVTDSSEQFTKSSEKTFTFVYPYYRGVIGATTSISADVVTGLNKEVQTKGNYSYEYTTSNQKPVIAYPKSYGELTSITDAALPYTWTRSEVTVKANDNTNVVYYVYVGDASTMTNTYNFKY
jgi:hypothetical protein